MENKKKLFLGATLNTQIPIMEWVRSMCGLGFTHQRHKIQAQTGLLSEILMFSYSLAKS